MTRVLIDSHCHLDLAAFDNDLEDTLDRAYQAGVMACLVPAIDRAHWAGLEQLAEAGTSQNQPELAFAIGLHPCFAHYPGDLQALADRLERPHPYIAIGECGLDSVAGIASLVQQQQLCEGQLQLARQYNLPVILHVRKAHNELLTLLTRNPLPAGGVIHGFSGSIELAQQYIRHGLKIGIGGVISYQRAAKTRATVAKLPLSSLLLETDSPDMPLHGFQGQRNEPARLLNTLKCIADLRPEAVSELRSILARNALELFTGLNLRV